MKASNFIVLSIIVLSFINCGGGDSKDLNKDQFKARIENSKILSELTKKKINNNLGEIEKEALLNDPNNPMYSEDALDVILNSNSEEGHKFNEKEKAEILDEFLDISKQNHNDKALDNLLPSHLIGNTEKGTSLNLPYSNIKSKPIHEKKGSHKIQNSSKIIFGTTYDFEEDTIILIHDNIDEQNYQTKKAPITINESLHIKDTNMLASAYEENYDYNSGTLKFKVPKPEGSSIFEGINPKRVNILFIGIPESYNHKGIYDREYPIEKVGTFLSGDENFNAHTQFNYWSFCLSGLNRFSSQLLNDYPLQNSYISIDNRIEVGLNKKFNIDDYEHDLTLYSLFRERVKLPLKTQLEIYLNYLQYLESSLQELNQHCTKIHSLNLPSVLNKRLKEYKRLYSQTIQIMPGEKSIEDLIYESEIKEEKNDTTQKTNLINILDYNLIEMDKIAEEIVVLNILNNYIEMNDPTLFIADEEIMTQVIKSIRDINPNSKFIVESSAKYKYHNGIYSEVSCSSDSLTFAIFS